MWLGTRSRSLQPISFSAWDSGGTVTKRPFSSTRTEQLEGCSHELSLQAGRWKWRFPLTVSEEPCSRDFLSGSCINRWRASVLQLLSSRENWSTCSAELHPSLCSCASKKELFALKKKKNSSRVTLLEKHSLLLKHKEYTGNFLGGGVYVCVYISSLLKSKLTSS